ncbi:MULTISPECIES: NAD(P)-dependent alcohol dehydrogenase [Saccharothrix]|uniref:NAD(P)-dependent alcohol dehydrogenase n=1 Tax=Saccharothrix TaxID=2071 RepID=UPI00093E1B78|nr:NAD(P)-dependent alcohol dehydrogenase [Saccharothrix sp. CB00851]OKI16260.1 NADPH:quinone reductase [Saccharothrix sp. CB00851]
MKAITQHRYGSPDVLRLSEVDRPVPADDQVLVRVRAATVNARDWHVMRGDPYLARLMPGVMGLRGPRVGILGTDFAGVVEAVGARVTRFRPGDEVYGEADGAFAEYVCASHDVVERKPANLTFEQAAALPLAANTALMGLRDQGQVRPGQRVLVNGASGGVGTFAVQLGRWLGAEVTAVCGTRNVELVASLGADHVIDYRQDDFTRDTGRYDVVFDLVGNHSLTALLRTLRAGGALVLSGGGVSTGGSLVGPMGLIVRAKLAGAFIRRHRVLVLEARPGRENLATLGELAEAGTLVPVIDRTYELGEVPEAIRYVEDEHARAKVVITV